MSRGTDADGRTGILTGMLGAMPILCPTPKENLLDAQGRPYFLWDVDLSLGAFRERLRTGSRTERAYWTGKLLRQAKPDDALQWVTSADVVELWPDLQRHLGRSRDFWAWLLELWGHKLVATTDGAPRDGV